MKGGVPNNLSKDGLKSGNAAAPSSTNPADNGSSGLDVGNEFHELYNPAKLN